MVSRSRLVFLLIVHAFSLLSGISLFLSPPPRWGVSAQEPLPCSEPDQYTPTFADVQLSPTRRAWAHSNAVVFTDCGLGAENYTLFIYTNQVTSFTWVGDGLIHYETLLWGEFTYDFNTREAVVLNHPDHEPTHEHEPRTPEPTPIDNEGGNIGGPGGREDPAYYQTSTPLPPPTYERRSWFWRLTH